MSYFLGGPRRDAFDDDMFLESCWDDDPRDRAPALTLAPAQRVALVAAVEWGLREHGCDNTLHAAQQWAAGTGANWPRLQAQLEANGGYCDCEILFNVLPPDDGGPD